MTPARALNDGRTSAAQNASLLSETESLAELMVQEMTALALQRTSNNMTFQQMGAFNNPNSDPSVEPKPAGTLADHGKSPAALVTTAPLAKMVEHPVTRSALHHSGSSDSSPFRTDGENGFRDGAAARVKPAAAVAPSDRERHKTGRTPDGLSEAESMAELMVQSVTMTALQRSGRSKSSLLRADPENTPTSSTVKYDVVKEEGTGEGGKSMDAEETFPTTREGVLKQKESFAELVVQSVTASALQHSTSNLLKISMGNGLRLANDDSTGKSDRKDVGEGTGEAAGYASRNCADGDAMHATVTKTVDNDGGTAKSAADTTTTKSSAAGEAKMLEEADKTAQSKNLSSGPRNSDGDLSGGVADCGKELQAVKKGDQDTGTGGFVGRSSGKNGVGEQDAVRDPNANHYGREEDGRNGDHFHGYSSDSFEKEENAQNRSGGSSSSLDSDSSDSRGNQIRRPQQPVREISTILLAVSSTSAPQGGNAASLCSASASFDATSQGSTGGSTTPVPPGAFVGLAALNRGLSEWFSGEVIAPSTAVAISVLEKQLPNASSSASQLAGDVADLAGAPSLNDCSTSNNGRVNVTASEVHTQMEPGIGNARVARAALWDIQVPEKHPARLFHLLWQRNRQAGVVGAYFAIPRVGRSENTLERDVRGKIKTLSILSPNPISMSTGEKISPVALHMKFSETTDVSLYERVQTPP